MTIDTVKDFFHRFLHRHDAEVILENDPISQERIDEMQRDIESKLRKGMKFTPAGPAGW